jgi:hypothetical protein
MLDSALRTIFASQWQVLVVAALACLAAAEVGFRVGLRCTHDEARKAQVSGIQGAILGLLALLLGFTFAMAAGRYDDRRSLVLHEANAIGTTYLRASLLGDDQQGEVERLLRDYVAARLDFYNAGADQGKQAAAEDTTAKIQRELWSHAVAAATEAPTPVTATFITSLNETIDLDASRLFALRTHVPSAVWLLLFIVAAFGCYTCGYAAGASGARSQFPSLVVPLLIAVVIALIADLDRPRGGLIGISQQPLVNLQETLTPGVE